MKPPRYTHAFVDRTGKARFYLRLPGRKRVSLPGMPWSPEFMAARAAAMESEEHKAPPIGSSATVAGTVNAAIVGYYQSNAWKVDLGEASRHERRPILERFREEHGDKRLALIHATAIRNILSSKSPASQRHFRRAVRGFIKWAIGQGLLTTDPFATITLSKQKQKGEFRGIIPWRPKECAQFEKFYELGTRERLAYELLLQAGQSKCDVVRMGRQHIRNGVLSMRRQKTGVAFYVPVTAELQAAIDAAPSEHLTFLVTTQGKPFTAAGFGNWFREVVAKAGLPTKDEETGKPRCTSHGLRKAAASRLASRGATTTQLKAWFGWKTSSEADLYTEAAEGEQSARDAAERLKGRTLIGKLKKRFAKIDAKPLK